MEERTPRPFPQSFSSRASRVLSLLLIAAFVTFLVLPQLLTLVFALATSWTTTILPKGLTTKWFVQTVQQRRFFETLQRSILLGLSVIVIDLVLVVPALVVLTVKRTKARILLDMATLFPYTMPGVVLALALIRFYGWLFPAILSTPWLLAAAHASLALPIVYWAVLNNLKAIKLHELFEAAQTCGARWPQILRLVVLPNIRTGIAISAVAGFAASFTDFAVANFIVGGIWPTFSVWQGGLIRLNSRFMAVTAIVSFLITITTTLIVMRLSRTPGPPKSIS
jgi:putative spermidine/putrescine transport system permease protein